MGIIKLVDLNVLRTAPELSDSNVIKGAWKPIALARHRLMINPTKDDSVHSVDNPAYWASEAKYSRSNGVNRFQE